MFHWQRVLQLVGLQQKLNVYKFKLFSYKRSIADAGIIIGICVKQSRYELGMDGIRHWQNANSITNKQIFL